MKRVAILILTITILVLSIPYAQAADYALLKNEYIRNHPGQAIIPYPWEPITSERVLPFNYEIPSGPANNFSIIACRNQFESASFIINAQKDLYGIKISAPNLYNAQGNSIPADAINIRIVKVWYQAAKDNVLYTTNPGYYLAPELLLKDDSLVNVNYETKSNYLKVTINGSEQYIEISNPNNTFPSNAQIHDALSLQPFALKANENKQIWLTVHVPNNTPPGDYYGNISITTNSEVPVLMNFNVKVLPFELESPPIEYGLYYRSLLPSIATEEQNVGINSPWRTPEQYTKELQNMKDHGVLYPTIEQGYDNWSPVIQSLNHALSLRKQTGLPTDHIYVLNFDNMQIDKSNQKINLTKLEQDANNWKTITSQNGFGDVYIYGIDEASGDVLRVERSAFLTVHTTGVKVFVACYNDAVEVVGDLLDVAVVAGPLNTTQAAQWHSYGKQIFSYENPQVGVENPDIYRKNYGFALWNAGYDGAMDFAYQTRYGQSIWNDFDTPPKNYNKYIPRDHVFAYPSSDGVIDTIQWEGWREGVDDTRYLATLIKLEGSDISTRAIVSGSLSKGEDMATIREKIIAQILLTSSLPKMGIYQKGMWYWDDNRNGVWDAGTDKVYQFGATGWTSVLGNWNGDNNGTKIGVYKDGTWYLDYDGNGAWDAGTDKQYNFGATGWTSVVGDWNGDGKTEVGVYQNGVWYLDWNGNGSWDIGTDKVYNFGTIGWTSVVGDWNGDGKGPKIGVYKDGVWYLDWNGNGMWDASADKVYQFGAPGWTSVVGNWNGDNNGTKIGIHKDGIWYLDYNGNGAWNAGIDRVYSFGMTTWALIVGDWNGDGKGTKIGVYKDGVWYLDWNGNGAWDAGTDKQYNFGAAGWIPIMGK